MITSNYHVCACCRLLCVWGWWSSRIHCHGTWLDHPIKNTIYWWVGYFPMCFHQFNNFWRVHAGICLDSLCAQPVAALLSLESDTTSSCNSVIVMVGVMDTAWQGHVWPLFGLENHGKPWKKRYKAKPLFLFGGDIVAGFFWRSFQCLNVRTVTPLCFVKSLFGLNFATMYISLIILLIFGCSIQPNAAISRHTKHILWLIGNILVHPIKFPPIIIWWGLHYMHAACAERLRPRPPKKNQGEGVKDCWHSKSKARLCLGLFVKLVLR